jgi:DNA-binding NarL/FixJ family response regulator
MLKTHLELRGGFEVLAAEDSEKGCKSAATKRPDVMLMDLEMPDESPHQILKGAKPGGSQGSTDVSGAKLISEFAKQGERDPVRLRNLVLKTAPPDRRALHVMSRGL